MTLNPTAPTGNVQFFQHEIGALRRLLENDPLEDLPTIIYHGNTSGFGFG